MSGTDNQWALWLYNNDANGFSGAFRHHYNDSIIISQFDGEYRNEYYYNKITKQRDVNRIYEKVKHAPRSRPCDDLAINKLGTNKAHWATPYKFATGYVGMSLVSSFIDNGTLLILLSEITMKALAIKSDKSEHNI